jgi:hypothetical protein
MKSNKLDVILIMEYKINNRMPYVNILIFFIKIFVFGCLACAIMDLWGLVLFFVYKVPLEWHFIGRLVGHIFKGDFFISDLKKASPVPYENTIGWIAHYATGVFYSFCYLFFTYRVLNKKPNIFSSILVSWFFMFVPFCIYQPLVGMGYFCNLSPHQLYYIMITISIHTSFGIGLYIAYYLFCCFKIKLPFDPKAKH